MVSRSVKMVEIPETEAHSPEPLRNAMLICGSESISSVFPDSVLVWKIRSMPPFSCSFVRCSKDQDIKIAYLGC